MIKLSVASGSPASCRGWCRGLELSGSSQITLSWLISAKALYVGLFSDWLSISEQLQLTVLHLTHKHNSLFHKLCWTPEIVSHQIKWCLTDLNKNALLAHASSFPWTFPDNQQLFFFLVELGWGLGLMLPYYTLPHLR